MTDPRHRLYRPILGEHLGEVLPLVTRVAARDRDPGRKEVVGQHREPVDYKVRALSPRVEPGPNCPQLIRLVRSPYALDRGSFQRRSLGDRARVEVRERSDRQAELREARDAGRREPFPKPTDCHPPIRREALPTIGDWLAGGGR